MTRGLRHTDTGMGWVNRAIADIRRELREIRAEKRLQAATIGKGGIKMLAGAAIAALYPSGRKVLQLGSFTGTNSSLSLVPGVGLQLLLDDEWGPGVPKSFVDLFRDETTGEFNAQISGATQFYVFSAKDAKLYGSNSNASVGVEQSGDVTLSPKSGRDVQMFVGTSGGSPNAVIDAATGAVTRSTSSRRYKQDIDTVTVDVAKVLSLTPHRFRLKAEVDKHGGNAPVYAGFIAEDAHDLGLSEWVTYDAEGRPDAFSYATFCVAQQAALRQLNDRVKALESAAKGDPAAG